MGLLKEGCIACFFIRVLGNNRDMKQFDYKHVNCSLPSGVTKMMNELRKLGKDGWELVSVCPSVSSQYGNEELTAFLKKGIDQ